MLKNKFLIQILKDHLTNQPTVLPENINLTSLVDIAKKQNLDGIVYYQTKIPQLQKNYAAAIFNFINRKSILGEIEKSLQENDIEYFLVKGFSVAFLYPQPQLRTMGDCDIVVHTEDMEKVHNILISLGLKSDKKTQNEWQYYSGNMEFEIHNHLIYESSTNPEKVVEFFDTAWSYVNDNKLDWNFHFLFLLYHLRKHIMSTGAGIRQFMDLAVVIKNINFDWCQVKSDIEYLDMTEFCNHVFMLLNLWFDIEIPVYHMAVDQNFVDTVTDKILNDGVFGFSDEGNTTNNYINDLNNRGKIGGFIGDVFYPYKKLIKIDGYEFLKGRSYLLPVAWIYRIFRSLKKIEELKDRYKERFTLDENKVNTRMAYLKQWGL